MPQRFGRELSVLARERLSGEVKANYIYKRRLVCENITIPKPIEAAMETSEIYLSKIKELELKKHDAREVYISLPIQPMIAPYEPITANEWKIEVADDETICMNYFSIPTKAKTCLLRKTAGKNVGIWMSVTPMELQSATIHLNTLVEVAEQKWNESFEPAAIVIGGFGMGLFLMNALHHLYTKGIPAEIYVYDVVPEIPDLISQSTSGYIKELLDLSYNEMLDQTTMVLIEDILKAKPIEQVDYMYVDIWQNLGSKDALTQSKALVEKWKPTKYGYWGEEIDIGADADQLLKKLPFSDLYQREEILEACKSISLGHGGRHK